MLAVLCGGQGELSAEIFDLTAERPEVTEIFATAAELPACDPRDMIRRDNPCILLADRGSQILSVTAGLAAYACITDRFPARVA
jgi:[acyl-carrier-protein] S-malonyltransferase